MISHNVENGERLKKVTDKLFNNKYGPVLGAYTAYTVHVFSNYLDIPYKYNLIWLKLFNIVSLFSQRLVIIRIDRKQLESSYISPSTRARVGACIEEWCFRRYASRDTFYWQCCLATPQ